jgi:hypothetical protein
MCAINVKECILHEKYNNNLTFIAQKTADDTPLVNVLHHDLLGPWMMEQIVDEFVTVSSTLEMRLGSLPYVCHIDISIIFFCMNDFFK